jgi:hypothetical protein
MASSDTQLSFGLVDGRPVFMDQQADSYFRLDGEAEAEFLGLIGNGGPLLKPSNLLLEALGLSPGQSVSQARCERPASSLLDGCDALRPTIADLAKASLVVHSARRTLARQPIGEILARLGSAGPARARSAARQQIPLARRFLAARSLVPVRTNCLLDSIAILKWLGPEAAGSSLVFAVKLDPFAAHCWVQNDRMLINDVADTVAAFVPVRVIRCSAPGR